MAHVSIGNVNIGFEYDAATDIHVAYPCCRLVSPEDCVSWWNAYEAYFKPIGHKVDAVFVLEMFSFETAVADAFRIGRQRIFDDFVRHSVRVASGAQSALFISWISRRDRRAHNAFAEDVPSAMAMILDWRNAAKRA